MCIRDRETLLVVKEKIEEVKKWSKDQIKELDDIFETILEHAKNMRDKAVREIENHILQLEVFAVELKSTLNNSHPLRSSHKNLKRIAKLEEMLEIYKGRYENVATMNSDFKQCLEKVRSIFIKEASDVNRDSFCQAIQSEGSPTYKKTLKNSKVLVNIIPRAPCKFIKEKFALNRSKRSRLQLANSTENSKMMNRGSSTERVNNRENSFNRAIVGCSFSNCIGN
eukprot:TRINITY_DN13643_c0_g1_i1.p1 TRINITY_DN13643_c0_g1~~TRINITY_DN13643_c0_g1_i1.p1  ORF type:complete len:225 (+),score=20.62 TRINITY_DN13643_c0_g1_i1:74-748(+)